MTIIEFYQELSKILEYARERVLDLPIARKKLQDLQKKAKESNLDVNIDPKKLLDDEFLMRLDDEKSFEIEDSYDDNSYED